LNINSKNIRAACANGRVCCWLAAALLFILPPASRADDALPPDVFTAIMLKSQNYDRNITRIAKDKVVIGIVYASGDDEGKDFASAVNGDIDKVKGAFALKGKAVEGKVMSLEKSFDRKKFEEQLSENNISVLVLVHNASSNKEVFETTRALQINSICNDPACPGKGVGLGIVQRDNKPLMLVNLSSMKAEGSDYSANFLTLAEQVE
jgi:hypothetical protein